MQEKLVIYLHADDLSRPSWAVLNADHTVRQSAYRDTADGLVEIAAEKTVLVIVPSEDVLLTSVTLPKMNRTRLMQALPFALEEQLVADIEELHFAPGELGEHDLLPVAIVTHHKMQQWLALLTAWQLQANALIPAIFSVPISEHTWHIVFSDLALIRTSPLYGFTSDKQNLMEMFHLALNTSEHKPHSIVLHNYTSHAFASLLASTVPLTENFYPAEQLITDAAGIVTQNDTFNLLQGQYQPKKSRMPKMDKVTQAITYLVAAWIFLLFFSPIVSSIILGSRVSDTEKQIAQIYKRNFPASSSIVAPKQRMQDKLQKLSAEVGASRLLLILGYVGKGMSEAQTIQLKRVDFQHNQLTLELSAATSDNFSTFTDYLTSQGLSVKQQNADLVGDRVNATLVVE